MPTRGQAIANTAHLDALGKKIDAHKASKESKLGDLLVNAKQKLQRAQSIVNAVDGAINSSTATKNLADEIFAPAKAVASLLEAIADVHPAVRVVAVIVKGVVEIQIKAKQNDEQVAVVYFTMSTLLVLLSDLDSAFDQDEIHAQLQSLLDGVQETVKTFGNFCEVYYRENRIKKYVKCGVYKDKLADFASSFEQHKQHLRDLLQAQGALKLIDIQVDIKKVAAYIETKSAKEKQTEEFMEKHGGVNAVLKSNDDLDALAKVLKEKFDPQELRRSMRVDLQQALDANAELYALQLQQVTSKIESSLDGHTKSIITKLEEGPHEYIEDSDVRAVWKEMGSRLSAKTRVFLDALNAYFGRQFAKYELENGQQHDDTWTLYFLSRIVFYPAISEGIDEDSSGFVSVHEVNSFIKQRPGSWTVAQWFAFWAVGPYMTDGEHQERITSMVAELEDLVDEVLPQNARRVKYFCGILKKLRLISVYSNLPGSYGEDSDEDESYEQLEKLRVVWRNQEIKRVKDNLVRTQYRLRGVEAVAIITNGRRMEQCIMCLIYLLLRRHLKIVKLAQEQTISVAEFQDMRETWDYLFEAFDNRMDTLVQVWRQQRLDIRNQVECFAGGMFEDWYEKSQAEIDESSSELEYEEDDEYDYDDEEEEEAEVEAEIEAEDAETGHEEQVDEEEAPDTLQIHEAASAVDIASVMSKSERKKDENEDPRSFLLYPVPSEESDSYLETESDDSEWMTAEARKKKAEEQMNKRLENIEDKLSTIETLLQQLLLAQKATAEPSSPTQGPNKAKTAPSRLSPGALAAAGEHSDNGDDGNGEDDNDEGSGHHDTDGDEEDDDNIEHDDENDEEHDENEEDEDD